jgi:hypothetical protein
MEELITLLSWSNLGYHHMHSAWKAGGERENNANIATTRFLDYLSVSGR